MTKKLFCLAALALAAFVAGCSADTTTESESTTTTDNNGTLPAEQPSNSEVVTKPVAKTDPAASKNIATNGVTAHERTIDQLQLPELPLQAPALDLTRQPLNQ